MSARGRGGKFAKPKRGGGKHFSRNLRPLNAEGEVENMWGENGVKGDEDSSEEEEEDSSSEESSSNEEGPSKPEMTREERRAAARKRKEAAIAKQTGKKVAPGDVPSSSESEDEDEGMPANPNHTAKAQKQASAAPAAAADAPSAASSGKKKASEGGQLSRREREALQAQAAKERYQKLHAEGKTDEARADLERLKLVRERREEDAARKKAEAEEKAIHEKDKSEQMARMERQAALKQNKLGGKKKK